jgi:hypothetical protein
MNPFTPAELAEIDQETAKLAERTHYMVGVLREQRAKYGPEQALANLALFLSWPPYDDPEVRRSLLLVAFDMLADCLPERTDDL